MPQPPQTVLTISPSPLPFLSSISLLPCSLAFDGPAPISTYFHPRPYDAEDASSVKKGSHRQAAFRGRRLISSTFDVPQGYKGLVFSTEAAVPPTATEDDWEELEAEKNRKAREERSAKRAKLASDMEEGESKMNAGDTMRRSPRKAAKEARERAIKAAKEKAKAAKGKGKAKAGFSLDDDTDEDEDTQQAEESGSVEQETPLEETILETLESASTEPLPGPPNLAPPLPAEEAPSTVEASDPTPVFPPSDVTAPLSDSLPPSVPAPLLSRSSTSLSTHLHLPNTPSVSAHPSFSSIELARDEKHLKPFSTFDKIEVWNPDFMISGGRVEEEDEVARTVKEWIGLAAKVSTWTFHNLSFHRLIVNSFHLDRSTLTEPPLHHPLTSPSRSLTSVSICCLTLNLPIFISPFHLILLDYTSSFVFLTLSYSCRLAYRSAAFPTCNAMRCSANAMRDSSNKRSPFLATI